jgi:hypothetical protein
MKIEVPAFPPNLPELPAFTQDPLFGLVGFSAVMALLMALTGGFASKKLTAVQGRRARNLSDAGHHTATLCQ